jgi:hypothetical protein
MMTPLSADNDAKLYAEYYAEVASHIRDCLSGGPRPFAEVVRACEGADPIVVADCLDALKDELIATHVPALALSARGAGDSHLDSPLYSLEGNAALYSWYFKTKSCQRIGLVRDWSKLRLAFLGTPRLYEWFRNNGVGGKRLLLDSDRRVLELLSPALNVASDCVECYDVANEVPESHRGEYDCVFFDPPWKASAYLAWTRRALALAPGGSMFFPLLPFLTRPRAQEERQVVLRHVRELARTVTLLKDFLDYEIPTFKKAHLASRGLGDVTGWKGADLIIADAVRSGDVAAVDGAPARPSAWEEVDVGRLRVFVDRSRGDEGGGELLFARSESLVDSGDKDANVKTSRGHRLHTSRPEELIRVLTQLSEHSSRGVPVAAALKSLKLDDLTRSLLDQLLKESKYA